MAHLKQIDEAEVFTTTYTICTQRRVVFTKEFPLWSLQIRWQLQAALRPFRVAEVAHSLGSGCAAACQSKPTNRSEEEENDQPAAGLILCAARRKRLDSFLDAAEEHRAIQ
jgi:hypothetical protein